MSRFFRSLGFRRVLIALSVAAWLLGGAWHGAMQVQAANGDEICTAEGTKRVPGGLPGKLLSKTCAQCAAFSGPDIVPTGPVADLHFSSPAESVPAGHAGILFPASHLADLASQAPPRS